MNLEPLYDAQIAPLVAEIVRLAAEHGMPCLMAFQLTDQAYEDAQPRDAGRAGPSIALTCLLPDALSSPRLRAARQVLHPEPGMEVRLVVRSDPNIGN